MHTILVRYNILHLNAHTSIFLTASNIYMIYDLFMIILLVSNIETYLFSRHNLKYPSDIYISIHRRSRKVLSRVLIAYGKLLKDSIDTSIGPFRQEIRPRSGAWPHFSQSQNRCPTSIQREHTTTLQTGHAHWAWS